MATAVERRITERVGKELGKEVRLATPMTSMPTAVAIGFPLLAVAALIFLALGNASSSLMLGLLTLATVFGLMLGRSQRLFVVTDEGVSLYRVKPFSLLKPAAVDKTVDPHNLVVEYKPRGFNYRTKVEGKKYLVKRRFVEPYLAYIKSVDD